MTPIGRLEPARLAVSQTSEISATTPGSAIDARQHQRDREHRVEHHLVVQRPADAEDGIGLPAGIGVRHEEQAGEDGVGRQQGFGEQSMGGSSPAR